MPLWAAVLGAAAFAAHGFILVRDVLPYVTLRTGPNGNLQAQLDENAVRARVAHSRVTMPVLHDLVSLCGHSAGYVPSRAWAPTLCAQ